MAATGKPKTKGASSAHRKKRAYEFYARVMDAAERIELKEASEVEGLDGEIAVLRMRLRKAVDEHPEDLALMLRGVDLLVKAVSARYRLSKEAEEDLSESIAGVVRGVGGLLIPEAASGE